MLDTEGSESRCLNRTQILEVIRTFSEPKISLKLSPPSSPPINFRTEENPKKGKEPQTAQDYFQIHPKICPPLHKIDKLYVGLLRELPPPTAVYDKWEKEVRPDLERHLCQTTSMLPKSMRDEEIITEPVLCMTGLKASSAGASCPKNSVKLRPTLWIHCGSKKCRKRVMEAIRNLAYLNHFLSTFHMNSPCVSLHAPWPAGDDHPPAQLIEQTHGDMSLFIQYPMKCGSKVRFTIYTSNGVFECFSTLGGVIKVGGSLFGVTTAHGIVNCVNESSKGGITDASSSTDDCSSPSSFEDDASSESDFGTDNSSESDPEATQHAISATKTIRTTTFGLSTPSLEMADTACTWVQAPLPQIIAYKGQGTTIGDYMLPSAAPRTSDFILIDLAESGPFENDYLEPVSQTPEVITYVVPDAELSSGDVCVIANCFDKPIMGHILEGHSSLILRGTVFRTRKIQITSPGVPGLSGSWVVRGRQLCGTIYAAYDQSPYLHMISADSMFQDIREFLATSCVCVRPATGLRINQPISHMGSSLDLTKPLVADTSSALSSGLQPADTILPVISNTCRTEYSGDGKKKSTEKPFHPERDVDNRSGKEPDTEIVSAPIDGTIAGEFTLRFRDLLSKRRMKLLRCRPKSSERGLLKNLPLVPQLPHDVRSTRFKNFLYAISNGPCSWENPGLLDEALGVIPLQDLYTSADDESQLLQAEAKSLGQNAIYGYQDCVIRAMMRWFKNSFFSWVDNPNCKTCFSPTIAAGLAAPTPEEQAHSAKQVECYQCSNVACGSFTRFPRYVDPFVLLRTRKGRAGEWATCFAMLCRAAGSRVRYVWSNEDQVWIEVYSEHTGRWVHVDVCEGRYDQPLLYTEGWGKKLSYCIAFSAEGAMDVTSRYVRKSQYAAPRTLAAETALLHILEDIRAERRKTMGKHEQTRLNEENRRDTKELRGYVISSVARAVSELRVADILKGFSTRSSDHDRPKSLLAQISRSDQWTLADNDDEQGESNRQDFPDGSS